MPETLVGSYDVEGDRFVIHRKLRHAGQAKFLAFFLAIWSTGCVVLAHQAVTKPETGSIFWSVVLWAVWLLVAAMLVHQLFGQEELSTDGQSLHYWEKSPLWRTERGMPRDEVVNVGVLARSESKRGTRLRWGLHIETRGQPIEALKGLSEQELRWLAWQLSQALGKAHGGVIAETPAALISTPRAPQALGPAEKPLAPPADTRWEKIDVLDALEFTDRGRFSGSALLGIGLITVIWNAVVAVFLVVSIQQLLRGLYLMPIVMLLFLIPFELIGLLFLIALWQTPIEPFRVTRWIFTRDAIQHKTAWLGLGWPRTHAVETLAGIELGEDKRLSPQKRDKEAVQLGHMTGRHHLSFLLPSGKRLCRLKRLSEAEARWIADSVFRANAHWFPGIAAAPRRASPF